ncbi:hypothetical protein OF829_05940 [Sphingomonas sp. LB-2]|uniref:hypothetical protein n=1 Tax=Sphingomonas caeni TaxID=2984949 RepID=UPI0022302563|nr:hypothetical protein [Sphingomonas caeni]MCW3846773.1 hypothetical protein [Sphingomonas caeni]
MAITKPFEERLLKSDGDGDDFQRFVWEILSAGHFSEFRGQRYLRPHFRRGKDGAIDHAARGTDDCIVVESKFCAQTRTDGPKREWRKVASILRDNWRKLTSAPEREIPDIYAPWFDTDCPVIGYWFCTSGEFVHEGDQESLRREIEQFFRDMAKLPGLAHLAKVKARVLGWNDFSGALAVLPALKFSWFGSIPGIMPLADESDEGTARFQAFLQGNRLPYFSRTQFLEDSETPSESIRDEAGMLRLLFEGAGQNIIITGAGGVGKTRLALELGKRAQELDWAVWRIAPTASPSVVHELAREFKSEGRAVLVIDYSERVAQLASFAAACNEVALYGHKIRIVATCRSGALPIIQEAFADAPLTVIPLSDANNVRYARWVVRRILDHGEVPNPDLMARICGNVPVLAAFAFYLWRNFPNDFDSQFSMLLNTDDFARWIDKRVRAAVKMQRLDQARADARLAEIAAQLPLPRSQFETMRGRDAETRQLLDLLLKDHWIEPDEDMIAAAHDIFADALLARYVLESPETATFRAGDVLISAGAEGAVGTAITAFDRLSNQGHFRAIDGPALVARLANEHPEALAQGAVALLRSRLLDDRSKIESLRRVANLAAEARDNPDCDVPISQLAIGVVKSKDEDWKREAGETLEPFLDGVLARNDHGWIFGRLLRLFPAKYRDRALRWLEREGYSPTYHYLLVAWLLAKLPPEEISDYVKNWLAAGGADTPAASTVLPAWIDAVGPEEWILPYVRIWLATFAGTAEASFLYSAWLGSNGPIGAIDTYLLPWIVARSEESETRYLLTAWLRSKGSPAAVENSIDIWLGAHGLSAEADRLLRSWLKATENRERFSDRILAWLRHHEGEADDSQLMTAWLRLEGDLAAIEPQVSAWLETHWADFNAHHLLQRWLRRKGDPQLVSKAVERWLGVHSDSEPAAYVLQAWLRAGGDPQLVLPRIPTGLAEDGAQSPAGRLAEDGLANGEVPPGESQALLAWLETHGLEIGAHNMLQAWLRTGGDVAVVGGAVTQWLALHGTLPVARYLIEAWLGAGGSPALVQGPVGIWFGVHGTDPQARYLIDGWLSADGDSRAISDTVSTWLGAEGQTAVHSVLQSWLRAKGDPALVRDALIAWLVDHAEDHHAGYVIRFWTRAGGDWPAVQEAFLRWFGANPGHGVAGSLLRHWIRTAVDPEEWRTHLLAWFENHAIAPDAGGILLVWIRDVGEPQPIEGAMARWLDANPSIEDAALLRKWLEANGRPEIVGKQVSAWLRDVGGDNAESSYVMQAWLTSGGEAEHIRPYVERYLADNRGEFRSHYLLKKWLLAGGDRAVVRDAVAAWLETNNQGPAYQTLIQTWLAHGGEPELVAPFMHAEGDQPGI